MYTLEIYSATVKNESEKQMEQINERNNSYTS